VHDVLHPRIDRQGQRPAFGAQTFVEGFFNAGEAVIVYVGEAENVGHWPTVRIHPRFLALKVQPGNAQAQYLPLLLRG